MPASNKGRAHGAPPQPLVTSHNPWPTEEIYYNTEDVVAMPQLTSSKANYKAAAKMGPVELGKYLLSYPFVEAVAIDNYPHIIEGFEWAVLATRHNLPKVLVKVIQIKSQSELEHFIYLRKIGPNLPGASDRSAATLYEETVKLLNSKHKLSRLFPPDTSEIEATRTVMNEKTAYKERDARNERSQKTSKAPCSVATQAAKQDHKSVHRSAQASEHTEEPQPSPNSNQSKGKQGQSSNDPDDSSNSDQPQDIFAMKVKEALRTTPFPKLLSPEFLIPFLEENGKYMRDRPDA
jgi:hypothetical protein